jgi:hypothetical protein
MPYSGPDDTHEHHPMSPATSLPRVGCNDFRNFSVTARCLLRPHQLEATLPQGHTSLSDRVGTYSRPDPTVGPTIVGWLDDPPVLSHSDLSALIPYAIKAEEEAFSHGYATALK